MRIKTIQWNIGGGKIRLMNDSAIDARSYKIEGINYIVDFLLSQKPDIVTFQETHEDEKGSQLEIFSKKAGLPYFFNDPYDVSHIDPSQKLGQGVLSRFEILGHSFQFFINPHFEHIEENGEKWISHDKGVSSADLKVGDGILFLKTNHAIPFKLFEIPYENKRVKSVLADMAQKLSTSRSPFLVQGDFNVDSPILTGFLPFLFQNALQEIVLDQPTTPKGRKYDHILYRGLKFISYRICNEALTDHYPIVCEFEL